jgi:myosin heavy subunit
MSPSRPHTLRKRQSLQIVDLESRVEQLARENRELQEARSRLESTSRDLSGERQTYTSTVRNATEQIAQRDEQIRELQDNLASLQNEVDRLAQDNALLTEQNQGIATDKALDISSGQDESYAKWQEALVVISALKIQQKTMSDNMEGMVRDEISKATADQEREIQRLQSELNESMEQTQKLQQQILTQNGTGDDFLVVRDEDYFEGACTQLCSHVQQWVLRYSKFSDTKACRLSSDVKDDKIEARLDDAILDGSDVDALLNDRVKRRDVFMSVVMSMIWEYVFTRYLFGLDQSQRQKLKSIEKQLTEIGEFPTSDLYNITVLTCQSGPRKAVAQWRAITLTLLSRRESFQNQRAQDTEAVVLEIFATLSRLLSPPSHLKPQVLESLRKVMALAVDLSIQMRTQRPEFIMLPPLRPEYDTSGDLLAKVSFNADLMNERSGETTSNEDLESQGAVVKIVLFPLVVKKGDDFGEGEDEVVVCPAQVLVAKPQKGKKVVRVMSGAMDVDQRRSSTILPEEGVPF